MMEKQPNNPLHGVTLVTILEFLVEKYGWEPLGDKIPIKCFTHNPHWSQVWFFCVKHLGHVKN